LSAPTPASEVADGCCPWALGSEVERDYHDREWGVPLHGERALFEFLTLEGAQAGLSWRTVLNKRDGYRRVFLDYCIEALAQLDDAALEQRLLDPGIVRNRLKVWSVRGNARAVLALHAEGSSLDALLWSFVDGRPQQGGRRQMGDVPARSEASDRMSKALAKRGFKFVGSTICYALMQATGMVNDHLRGCPRHAEVLRLGA
jgi:DNA-3-methyladenine glycosylase I